MNLFEWSDRLLSRHAANNPKVAVLLSIFVGGMFAVDWVGVKDLASPWFAMPLLPIALI